MDEKSINLWRQIEGCRQSRGRGKGATPLASTVANDPVYEARDYEFRRPSAAKRLRGNR